MKRFLLLLVMAAALTSCEEDVKFNNPAVQGFKDGEKWKAGDFTASVGDDNSLTVIAHKDFETLTIRVQNYAAGTYTVGAGSSTIGQYQFEADGISEEYTTNADSDRVNGEITISALPSETDLSKGYITGTFRFTAVDSEDYEVTFDQGWFYKVPVTPVAP